MERVDLLTTRRTVPRVSRNIIVITCPSDARIEMYGSALEAWTIWEPKSRGMCCSCVVPARRWKISLGLSKTRLVI